MPDIEQNKNQGGRRDEIGPAGSAQELSASDNSVKPRIKRSLFRKIVNVFIGIFLGLVILIVIVVGFTQTKTFRNILREKVISIVNGEINGKLSIAQIDGTILTSIYLRNTSLIVDNDTLLFARKIEIKTSPLQLLLKKIFVRKILLEDVKIRMLQDQAGAWNYEKLIKQTPDDTTKSSFSFLIQANDIQFRNISFIRQSNANLGSQQVYTELNPEDLRIADLNFSAQAYADVEKSNYLLIIKELSLRPNLSRFNLKFFSGEFAVTKEFASISNFYFLSDSSELRLDARLDSLNLFGDVELDDFKNYPISLDARAKSFNFDDLSSFIGSTEILKGNPSMELKARGKFGDFRIDKFSLDYKDSHFEIDGRVRNLNRPEKLFITAKITDSDINYKDINTLLPTLKLPEYARLRLTNLNLDFEGEPLNFKSRFEGNIDDGKLLFNARMNLASDPVSYDISFETDNLDLSPVLDIPTQLNSRGSLIGKGFSPVDMKNDFDFIAGDSRINSYAIDRMSLNSHSIDGTTNLRLDAASDNLTASINGDLSFDKDTIPAYSLVGQLKNLNLAKFLKDEKYESNLNFYLSADGRNFNPDDITGILRVGIDSSRFQGERISNSDIQCTFSKETDGSRQIKLVSDFADFNINGNFSVQKAIDLIAYESQTISGIISKKIRELNPLSIVLPQDGKDSTITFLPSIVEEDLKFNFGGTFKDIELLSKLTGYERLDLSGEFGGNVKNEAGKFSISANLDLDYFVMMQKSGTIYLSGFNTDLNFTRDNRSLSFDRLFGTASLTGKRFYSGSNVKAIEADITFNQSKLFFSASANIADMIDAGLDGIILMT
ncbi:MAG: hypothetical protein WC061_02845, partial [Melioribacteraceae bacterium]